MPRVAIVGAGLVTPLGGDLETTWQRVLAGEFITDHATAAGQWDGREPRVIDLARRATRPAVEQAGWHGGDEYTLVVGTSKGAIENWISPAGGLDPSGLAQIAAALGRAGPHLTVSGACASGLVALARASMMIRAGEANRVLVVAAEASVHPLFIGSFTRLGVLAKSEVGCRPFDIDRSGFLMSEAAAAVCLEGRSAGEPGAKPLAFVERFALGGDAHHLTAGDPRGDLMQRLLMAVIRDRQVDLIHAHGTGTQLNDPAELAAIEAALEGTPIPRPSIFSHKAALGHSLGASGLVSVVLNLRSHALGIVPPNIRTRRPLAASRSTLSQSETRRPIYRSVVSASGFGGASATVSLTHT